MAATPYATGPIDFRQSDLFERLPLLVLPERDAVAAPIRVTESEVHPAIVIEVEYRDGVCAAPSRERSASGEGPLSRILKDCCGASKTGDHDVHSSIVVVVGSHNRRVETSRGKPSLAADIGKCAVSIITPTSFVPPGASRAGVSSSFSR